MSDSLIESLFRLLIDGLWALPFLCVWATGLGFCIHFRATNSIAANLSIAAFSIFILSMIFSILIHTWWMHSVVQNEMNIGTFYIMRAINTLLSIAGWVLLLVAIHKLLQPKTESGSSP